MNIEPKEEALEGCDRERSKDHLLSRRDSEDKGSRSQCYPDFINLFASLFFPLVMKETMKRGGKLAQEQEWSKHLVWRVPREGIGIDQGHGMEHDLVAAFGEVRVTSNGGSR